jgi:hypothetical protein
MTGGDKKMERSIERLGVLIALGSLILTTGCASYYKVKDPQSGSLYFTKKIHTQRSGSINLKDDRSGSNVTLQNSEIKEITADEYNEGLKAPQTAPAASPAAAAATAPAATSKAPEATAPPATSNAAATSESDASAPATSSASGAASTSAPAPSVKPAPTPAIKPPPMPVAKPATLP